MGSAARSQQDLLDGDAAVVVPDVYASKAQLRTLQRRVKVWRAERVRELILGGLRKSADTPVEA